MPDVLPPTDRSLPIALIRARETVMAPIRQMLAAEGITEQQWRVLRVLGEVGPMTATEVCGRAGLLAPSFTRIATTMVDKGLVSRAQHLTDRRSQTYLITDTGTALLTRNRALALQIVAGYRAHLGSDRYELLLDLLAHLAEPLDLGVMKHGAAGED